MMQSFRVCDRVADPSGKGVKPGGSIKTILSAMPVHLPCIVIIPLTSFLNEARGKPFSHENYRQPKNATNFCLTVLGQYGS